MLNTNDHNYPPSAIFDGDGRGGKIVADRSLAVYVYSHGSALGRRNEIGAGYDFDAVCLYGAATGDGYRSINADRSDFIVG